MTKSIKDNDTIYSLIIILNVGIIASLRCGLFKMLLNVNHLTMLLPFECLKIYKRSGKKVSLQNNRIFYSCMFLK